MQDVLPEITNRAVRYVHQHATRDEPFFLYFSMTSPHEPVVPSRNFRGRSGIAPIADFVMETDWSAGQVIRAVDEAGISDNTIVIFTADNGHSHYTGWDQLIAAGHRPNGPYRGHKGDVWEGGHRVPLVIRWPNKIRAGSTSDQLVSLTDLFATCADIIDADLPRRGAEDSLSFLPAVLGGTAARSSLISHANMGEFAYRDGAWKLVFKMSGRNLESSRGKRTIAELYNLNSDIAEEHNLAAKHPKSVQKLTNAMDEFIRRGATRKGLDARNDADVQFTITQTERWAPSLESSSN